jgi:Flp pilus assembly protein TadG
MSRTPNHTARSKARGQSLIELAIVLPIVLLLLWGVVDFGRAILFNNILVNMSREGANLASRTAQSPQFITDALNHTAAPLDMETHGMVFITRVRGVNVGSGGGKLMSVVQAQYRATPGYTPLTSKLTWTCTSWAGNGQCNLPTADADRVVVLPFALALGAELHVVETIYDYSPLTHYVMKSNVDLYSRTYL